MAERPRFLDKRVLITGAASGFGRRAAERFADEGARLAITDIDPDGLAETHGLIDGADVASIVADVSDEDDQRRLTAEAVHALGGLDIALNNAGAISPLNRIADTPVEDFDRMMAINARGVFLGMKYQLPVMSELGGGCILNTASVAGVIGAGMFGAYAASKHAVVGLTKAAADEYARHNIRINAICPAFAVTPMLEDVADNLGGGRDDTREDTYKRIAGRIPMRRVGETGEIVAVMLMLCDPDNSFMTGQAIAVDGGLTAV